MAILDRLREGGEHRVTPSERRRARAALERAVDGLREIARRDRLGEPGEGRRVERAERRRAGDGDQLRVGRRAADRRKQFEEVGSAGIDDQHVDGLARHGVEGLAGTGGDPDHVSEPAERRTDTVPRLRVVVDDEDDRRLAHGGSTPASRVTIRSGASGLGPSARVVFASSACSCRPDSVPTRPG